MYCSDTEHLHQLSACTHVHVYPYTPYLTWPTIYITHPTLPYRIPCVYPPPPLAAQLCTVHLYGSVTSPVFALDAVFLRTLMQKDPIFFRRVASVGRIEVQQVLIVLKYKC